MSGAQLKRWDTNSYSSNSPRKTSTTDSGFSKVLHGYLFPGMFREFKENLFVRNHERLSLKIPMLCCHIQNHYLSSVLMKRHPENMKSPIKFTRMLISEHLFLKTILMGFCYLFVVMNYFFFFAVNFRFIFFFSFFPFFKKVFKKSLSDSTEKC